ncbi:MAG: YndJ family transporter [Lewinellaceae bacterium]|nr:YndJ family transporter [Lewinellaceae bacterium]
MNNPQPPFRTTVLIGVSGWLLLSLFHLPGSIYAQVYPEIILMAGALVVAPLGLRIINQEFGTYGRMTAFLLGLSLLIPTGYFAGVLAAPYVLFSLSVIRKCQYPLKNIAPLISSIMLTVGALWAFAYRLGWSPFGYAPIIVLLTAVHFHYAGFALSVIAQTAGIGKLRASQLTIALAAGVVWVAAGILVTHFGGPVWLEAGGVTALSAMGILTGGLLLRSTIRPNPIVVKLLWLTAGSSLIAGMSLAFLYGWRHYCPISQLSIPWMYAVHGTLNSIGFAVPALISANILRGSSGKTSVQNSARKNKSASNNHN